MKKKIGLISQNETIVSRSQLLARMHDLDLQIFKSADSLLEQTDLHLELVFIDCLDCANPRASVERVQVARQVLPDTELLVVAEKKVDPDSASFIKKSGARAVLLEEDFISSSRADFFVARRLLGPYVAIKPYELIEGEKVDFRLFHFLPLNEKLIPIAAEGQVLEPSRLKKWRDAGEFYIRRDQAQAFVQYLDRHRDRISKGMAARCRTQFVGLSESYKNLIEILIDQSEGSSFVKGKELFQQVEDLSKSLLETLGVLGEAWDAVDQASLTRATLLDRVPNVAAFAGLLSLQSSVGNPDQVMVTALLADIGLVDLKAQLSDKILKTSPQSLDGIEFPQYARHPNMSVDLALNRKIPLPEKLKAAILATHERCDGKGFPLALPKDKIPEDSLIVAFGEKLDQSLKIEKGRQKRSAAEARSVLWKNEQLAGHFSIDMMEKLKSACLSA